MPVARVPYASVGALLGREPLAIEDAGTRALIAELKHVRRRGEFTRAEFLRMAHWKSPRAAPHYARNRPASIRKISRAVLAERDETRRLALLTSLHGVSVPVASAILTLLDPRRYGVLDIRVWQLLHAMGAVEGNPAGRGFSVTDWLAYLACLREGAKVSGASARIVEYTLFQCHRRLQLGRLYDKVSVPRSSLPSA